MLAGGQAGSPRRGVSERYHGFSRGAPFQILISNFQILYPLFSMRKFIPVFILVISMLVAPLAARAGVPQAVTYLKAQPQDEWSTMALVATGESSVSASHLASFTGSTVLDYAKRILALIAAGKNPRSFTGADLVAGLTSLASGGQLGDMSLLNDDAWGIIALRAVGVATADVVVADAMAYLLAHQEMDGGWGYGIGAGSDTDDTAAVLMALAEMNYTATNPVVVRGLSYLRTQQLSDAGFGYLASYGSSSDSTAWAVSALNRFSQAPASLTQGSATPISYLESLQLPDGGYKSVAGGDTLPWGSPNRAFSVPSIVIALLGKWYPVARAVSGGNGRVTPLADLAVTVALAPKADRRVAVSVGAENRGPNEASQTRVALTLPAGYAVTQVNPSVGSFDPATSVWELGRFRNFDRATLTFVLVAVPDTGGPAAVRAAVAAVELDLVGENDQAEAGWEFAVPQVLGVTSEAEPAASQPVEATVVCPATLPAALNETARAVYRGRFIAISGDPAGLLWYVDAVSGRVACLVGDTGVRSLLEQIALGVTDQNLERIPVAGSAPAGTPDALAERLEGRILLQVESVGEAWYVHAGFRTYLPPTAAAIELLRPLALVVPAA